MKTVCVITLFLFVLGCGEPKTKANKNPQGNSNGTAPELKGKTVGDVKLNPLKALTNVNVLIPDGFTKMSDEMLATKYPTANRPSTVYTNERGTVNIAFNHTANNISPSQLPDLHKQLDASIRLAQPKAQWMFSGFQNYSGRKWVQLEFVSQAVDTKIHNMMIATSASNRMLVISFNCTDELSKKWLGVGREIIKSVIVNE